MLEIWLLSAALAFPKACMDAGDLYHMAALVRDRGVTMENAIGQARDKRTKRILWHVYQRRDLTADQWRHLAIGACLGLKEEDNDSRIRPGRHVSR